MTCPPRSLRIGGDFEFHPDAFASRVPIPLDARYRGRHCVWTDTGRSALLIAAATIRQRGGSARAWLPAYGCESITVPFRQAGFEVAYYSGLPGEAVEPTSLPSPSSGETILYIHYFGHRNAAMARAAAQWQSAGIWIIEDCVQASLAAMPGSIGDFAVTSFRKLLPVVDGAALLSAEPADLAALELPLAPPDEAFTSEMLVGKLLRGADVEAEAFLPLFEHAENRLATKIVPRNVSWLSNWALARLDWADAAAKRRANRTVLSDQLAAAGLLDHLLPLFGALNDDEVPLAFPVRVMYGQRDDLRRHLAANAIYCPVHWPLDHLPAHEDFASERALASSMLTLPIDQRMSGEHVGRLVESLRSFYRAA